jgi:tRNA A-37 threonylcarbamoyl transferase component Bud32
MIGRTLGNCRIVEQIGMGGMATVYKAYDSGTDRYVAVKVLPEYYSRDPHFQERFAREARAIARLEHPTILPVHAFGEEGDISYLVMRYLPTGTLKDRIERGQLPLDKTSTILSQVADALDYAHEHNILHRDVKPSNVLIDERDNAYLTDFGIAKMVEATLDLTGERILGTPAYMSPEQCQGSKNLTPATDQYSLGIVLYEMLTGQTPFQAETPLALVYMQLNEPLPPPRSLRPDLPEDVERVLLKALSREPGARFGSCSAMAGAFARAIEGVPVEPPPTAVSAEARTMEEPPATTLGLEATPAVPARRLSSWLWAVIGVVVLAGLLGGASALGLFERGEASPTPMAGAPLQEQPTPVSAEATAVEGTEAEAEAPPASAPTPMPTPTEAGMAAQARAFADPILAAIADREPDFEDDFEDESGWPVGPMSDPEHTTGGHAAYVDGEYATVADAPDPEAPLNRNWCCSPGGKHEAMPLPVNFVLFVDVRIEAIQVGEWNVSFRGRWEEGGGEDNYFYDLSFDQSGVLALDRQLGDQRTELAEHQGSPLAGISETNHIVIVARGPQIAVYANGAPVLYVEDKEYVEQSSGVITILACNRRGDEPLEVRWDNLRVWNIRDLPLEGAESEMAAQARAFADPILDTIADREPDFEQDFEDESGGWAVGSISEPENTVGGFTTYVDGEYATIADAPDLDAPPDRNWLCSPVQNQALPYPVDFVLSFDARIEAIRNGAWHVSFREWWEEGGGEKKDFYDLGFSHLGAIALDRQLGDQRTELAKHQGSPLAGIYETNHILIVARGPQIAVYANGAPVLYVEDEEYVEQPWGVIMLMVCNHGRDGEPAEVRWDNLRIWYISDLAVE